MQDYKIKQQEYKNAINILLELVERKRDQIFDNEKISFNLS